MLWRIVIVLLGLVNTMIFIGMVGIGAQGSGQSMVGWPTGVGLLWGLGSTIGALVLHAHGKKSASAALLLFTVPIGFAILQQVLAIRREGIRSRMAKPSRTDFVAACVGAGPKYLDAPLAPVTSVAFDWPVSGEPGGVYAEVDGLGNLAFTSSHTNQLPRAAGLAFVERRQWQADAGNAQYPYLRTHGESSRQNASELTADALVYYESTSRKVNAKEEPIVTITATVTDRRDGRKLGTMRYAVDREHHRACGETAPGVIDETAFIIRAISPAR